MDIPVTFVNNYVYVCAIIIIVILCSGIPISLPIAPLDSSVSSVVKQSVAERWTTVSLRNGLQSLSDALLRQITENGVPVHIGQPCTKLTFDNGKAKVCYPYPRPQPFPIFFNARDRKECVEKDRVHENLVGLSSTTNPKAKV